jgi:hypothetical protein
MTTSLCGSIESAVVGKAEEAAVEEFWNSSTNHSKYYIKACIPMWKRGALVALKDMLLGWVASQPDTDTAQNDLLTISKKDPVHDSFKRT